MKQLVGLLAALVMLTAGRAAAQTSSLDALAKDLDDLKTQREQTTTLNISTMLDQLAAAMGGPDAALDLYQKAGGAMPTPTPVSTKYEHETPDEKAQRLAADAANNAALAQVAQIHCGLMRFGALFLLKPDTKNLQADWVAWLKSTGPLYGQITTHPAFKDVTLKESPLTPYFGFTKWAKSEQGKWSVKDLPPMYRKEVIEELRTAHSADLLPAWDTFIGMKSADENDSDKWNQVALPYLKFERGCDDFEVAPTTDKLATLVEIIRANPGHPQIDEMIARTRQMMRDYRAQKSGVAEPAATTTPPAAP
jgi:hypothetical protein